MFSRKPRPPKFAKVDIRPDEVLTVNGLAHDLSSMDALREKGIPISSATLNNDYYDGDVTDSFDMPYENHRGVDINDSWNMSKDIKSKLTKSKLKLTDVNPK